MISHITLGIDNLEKSEPFYDAIMGALGHPVFMERPGGKAYGTATSTKLFIGSTFNGEPATAGNGTHVAFLADSRSAVDQFHGAAMANSGTDEGAPGLRPHYHPNYYGAYVRDPEGNKLQAVCHRGNS